MGIWFRGIIYKTSLPSSFFLFLSMLCIYLIICTYPVYTVTSTHTLLILPRGTFSARTQHLPSINPSKSQIQVTFFALDPRPPLHQCIKIPNLSHIPPFASPPFCLKVISIVAVLLDFTCWRYMRPSPRSLTRPSYTASTPPRLYTLHIVRRESALNYML